MRPNAREALRLRFGQCCGYCGVSEESAGALLTVDHYQPVAHGGTDDDENLVYCCPACNSFKSDFWERPDEVRRILHPMRDDLALHLAEDASGFLQGLTETGRFHVAALQLNRPPLVRKRLRRRREEEVERSYAELRSVLFVLVQRVEQLEARIEGIGRESDS